MTEKTGKHDPDERPVSVPVLAAAPNPQGKGLVGVLEDWADSQPTGVVAKRPTQLLADYFTALLVLSSQFSFKPVRDTTYYLYFLDQAFSLSLVSPEEWQTGIRKEAFVGACVLHRDATWSITPGENLGRPGPVSEALGEAYRGFIERLGAQKDLQSGLPAYERRLPYYQRLYAAALGRSIGGSIRAAGQEGLDIEAWLDALPGNSSQLLEQLNEGD